MSRRWVSLRGCFHRNLIFRDGSEGLLAVSVEKLLHLTETQTAIHASIAEAAVKQEVLAATVRQMEQVQSKGAAADPEILGQELWTGIDDMEGRLLASLSEVGKQLAGRVAMLVRTHAIPRHNYHFHACL